MDSITKKKAIFVCEWCKSDFIEWIYRKPRFCSNQCRSEYASIQPRPNQRRPDSFVSVVCEQCNKNYTVHKCQKTKQNPTRFCSRKCQYDWLSENMKGIKNKLFRGGTLKLKDYGKSWFATKSAILKRDNRKCAVCKQEKKVMEVHHIVKLRYFNGDTEKANKPDNLITLCPQCHKKVEHGKVELKT